MSRRTTLLALMLGAFPARAATYVVDTTADSAAAAFQACSAAANDCSLRGAILRANGHAGADVVKVPAGTYPLTIAGLDDLGLVGDLDVKDTLTLRGLGGGATIDATAAGDRALELDAGAGSNVEVDNLVFTGGSGSAGGGVLANSGTVVIHDSVIRGNQASGAFGSGGGLYNNTATLTVARTLIEDNAAPLAGGVRNDISAGTLAIVDTTVRGNASDTDGGGLYNVATAPATIERSRFEGNTAGQSGGGIYNNLTGTLSVIDSRVEDNAAGGAVFYGIGGGGIMNDGDLTITGGTVSGNAALLAYGGGVFSYLDGTFSADGVVIADNQALYGGGVVLSTSGVLTGVTLADNVADADGGGLWGGGAGATIDLVDCVVDHNQAPNGHGGGLALGGASFNLTGCKVSRNLAYNFGGGIYQLDSVAPDRLAITDSAIADNQVTAATGEGGGLYSYTADTVLTRVSVTGNVAPGNGGGIKNTDGFMTIYGSTISGNLAGVDGGGIQTDYDGDPTRLSMTSSTISGNHAGGHGGGLYNDQDFGIADITLFNVTIAANDAAGAAGDGVYLAGGTLFAQHVIIGQQVTPGADCATVLGALIVAPGNNLEQGTSCGFATSGVAPLLGVLAANGGATATHALLAGSPAIDAGDPAGCQGDLDGDGLPETVLAVDQRDVARVGTCDLGAYEAP